MTGKPRLIITVLMATILLTWSTANLAARPLTSVSSHVEADSTGPSLYPEPTTIDRITHNVGNIVTTMDNWGYVGGYAGYLPSGEWPRNSGHDYLAEIRYWTGAVTAAGDTLVANTEDDFQAMPMPHNGVEAYKTFLSSDTVRFYDYDVSDTVGSEVGSPAFGWRIWDAQSGEYVYNTVYNSLSASFSPGGPMSLQDSHYRFNDASMGTSLLGLELTHTAMQWNYCYNEDFIFIALDITNASATDYAEFAFGLYVDMDVGGLDGLGGNGNMFDSVVYSVDDNWAYTYDVVGIDDGWGPTVQTGVMGTKLLETPNDIGMTAFRTDDWSRLPSDDAGRFEMINSTNFDTPLDPTDQYYVQCVRGINLTAGSTVRVVYALVAGADSAEFAGNAAMAQIMYDNNFVGPAPPPTPTLTARPGHERVYLSWGDSSEVGLDPLTSENDFVGYKLYRSDNLGKTWGVENRDNDNSCLEVDYIPITTAVVNTPGDPIAHSYIDEGLINGVEYWYCLVAFDRGDDTIDPLQSGFGIAGQSPNVVSVRPEANPAGYYEAAATVEHTYTGVEQPSWGEVIPTIFDESKLVGAGYRVEFRDAIDNNGYWYLINNTTGDTLLADQTVCNEEPDMYPVVEGLRVVVNDAEITPSEISQTGMAGTSVTLQVSDFNGRSIIYLGVWGVPPDSALGDARYRATYELRYTEDSTLAPWFWAPYVAGNEDPIPVPFEVWNMTTNQRVSLVLDAYDYHAEYQPSDSLIIVDYPYDPLLDLNVMGYCRYYSWGFNLDDNVYDPAIGDILTFAGAPINGPGDVFTFEIDGINKAQATTDLKKIKVVPNPYFVQYSSRVETVEGQSMLFFNNLPEQCTIRVYNLAGDLVKTIEHNDDSGSESWDLLSSSNRLITAGIYLFHVESEFGEHLGRFAVVK